MKTLNLTIGERFALRRMIDDEKGTGLTLGMLRIALKLADKVLITHEDLKKAKYSTDKKTNRQTWTEAGSEVEIEFTSDEVKLIREIVDRKDKDAKFVLDGGALMISLIDKLKQ